MARSKEDGGPGDDDVGRWREIAFERIHRWGAFVAIVVSMLVALGGGIDVASALVVCTILAVPLLYALRSRVSPRARAASFAVAMFAVAIVNFAASFLAKPFEASALIARVGELLADRPAVAAS